MQFLDDSLAGRVQVMISTPFRMAQPAKEGKLRVLAAAQPQRSQPFPDMARGSSPEELRGIVRTQLEFWRAAVRDGLIPRD